MHVHPVIFDPIYVPKIWGGRRLAAQFGKPLPAGQLIGESWELADLPGASSVVRDGPAKGRRLNDLVREWGADLLGSACLWEGQFPLLVKFLDASQDLSVQVHPSPHVARTEPGAVLKNEAWYVVSAEPASVMYLGLVPGVTEDRFRAAIHDGDFGSILHRVAARPGDCLYLPSGTVHALGAGMLVAEVQTPSDTTYRVFDWGRIDDTTGQPRELHIEQALRCVGFGAAAGPPLRPARSHKATLTTTVTRLAECEHFVIDKVRMAEGVHQAIPTGEVLVWIVLEGEVAVLWGAAGERLIGRPGDVVLIPAAVRQPRVEVLRAAVWLEATVPPRSGEAMP